MLPTFLGGDPRRLSAYTSYTGSIFNMIFNLWILGLNEQILGRGRGVDQSQKTGQESHEECVSAVREVGHVSTVNVTNFSGNRDYSASIK